MKTMPVLSGAVQGTLEGGGARKVWTRELRNQTFGFHLAGNLPDGNDSPQFGRGQYHRAHDVSNLFICDGSSFVTSVAGQPTCTIQALAYRLQITSSHG